MVAPAAGCVSRQNMQNMTFKECQSWITPNNNDRLIQMRDYAVIAAVPKPVTDQNYAANNRKTTEPAHVFKKTNLDEYFRLIEFVSTEGLGTKLSLNRQTVEPVRWLIIGS